MDQDRPKTLTKILTKTAESYDSVEEDEEDL